MNNHAEKNRYLLKTALKKLNLSMAEFAEIELLITTRSLQNKIAQKRPLKHKEVIIIENKTGLICNSDNRGMLILEEEN